MKLVKLFTVMAVGFTFMSFKTVECAKANTNYQATTNIYSAIKWKTDAIDLGDITQNKPVTIEFEFTNTSDADVIVANAQASCGCTVADYPKTPIAAGKSATISATFNAATKGVFTKNVTVTFQNEEAKVLNFKGTVI